MNTVARILLIVLPGPWLTAQDESPAAIDLVTHNAVRIEATPAGIWPHIVSPNDWKVGADLVSIGGEPGKRRERFKAVPPEDPDTTLFYVENVEVVPERRRTIRLNALDGQLIGYASWELVPRDDGTVVKYHVYTHVAPPAEISTTTEALATTGNDIYLSHHQRFAAELETLKRLVEGGE